MDSTWYVLGALFTLILGAYAWSWQLHRIAMREIRALWVRLTNHTAHEIKELRERISRLEQRSK